MRHTRGRHTVTVRGDSLPDTRDTQHVPTKYNKNNTLSPNRAVYAPATISITYIHTTILLYTFMPDQVVQ